MLKLKQSLRLELGIGRRARDFETTLHPTTPVTTHAFPQASAMWVGPRDNYYYNYKEVLGRTSTCMSAYLLRTGLPVRVNRVRERATARRIGLPHNGLTNLVVGRHGVGERKKVL